MKKPVILTLFFCACFFALSGSEKSFSDNAKVDSLLVFAHKYIGKPYRSGASGENAFDCSGFTSFVYKNFGYRLERVSANQTKNGLKISSKQQILPGDLVFFKGRNKNSSRIGHVGIAVEVFPDGTFSFIHAGVNQGVCIDVSTSKYYAPRYVTACRVITDGQALPFDSHLTEEQQAVQDFEYQKQHRVRKGETLYSISKKYHCSVNDIKEWNNLKSSRLSIGQELLLNPVPKKQEKSVIKEEIKMTEEPEFIKHKVEKGETMFSLSIKYGCQVQEIVAWNGLPSTSIFVGQELKIKPNPQQE